MNSLPTTGAVVLAAGAGRRIGSPKQLLPYHDTTLVGHIIQQVRRAEIASVVVVVGARPERVIPCLPDTVRMVYNAQWPQGMGTSLACGATALRNLRPSLEAVMVVLADHPQVTTSLLRTYLQLFDPASCDAIALQYPSGPGVPALFSATLWDALAQLSGDHGAKAILRNLQYVIRTVEQPAACLDIDTTHDYQQLIQYTSS